MKGHIRHLHPGECPPRCRNPASWQAIVYAGRDPVTGRKRQKTATRKGKREAEDTLAELIARYGHGRRVAPADATVEDLLWRWLEHAKTDGDGMSPPSASAAASHIRLYLAPRVGRRKVARLDAEDLVRCYDDLRAHGGLCRRCRRRVRDGLPPLGPGVEVDGWVVGGPGRGDRSHHRGPVPHATDCRAGVPLAPSYVRRIHATMHSALEYARLVLRWIDSNPAEGVAPKVRKRPVRPPRPTDVARLLGAAAERDFEFFVWLRLDAVTGARRGEVTALRWDSVDLDDAVVTMDRNLVMGHDDQGTPTLYEKDSTKEDEPKRVEVDAVTLGLLRELRRRARERALGVGMRLRPDAYVFSPDEAGRVPYRPSVMTFRFARLRRQVDLEQVRLHDLRHFVASAMLRGGIDLVRAAARTGHAETTLLRHYAHFIGGGREAALLLAGLVDGPGPGATAEAEDG
jgi:integrase